MVPAVVTDVELAADQSEQEHEAAAAAEADAVAGQSKFDVEAVLVEADLEAAHIP